MFDDDKKQDTHTTPPVSAEANPAPSPTEAQAQPAQPPKQRRGFAAMDRARVREIAQKGGLTAHRTGKAHRFTSEEARVAGHKGGVAPHRVRGRRMPSPQEP